MRDNKYGIPVSKDNDDRTALLQPKFTSRFRVLFPNLGESLPKSDDGISEQSRLYVTTQVESFKRPTMEFNNKPVYSFLSKGYITGKLNINEVTFTIRDDILNAGISFIYRQFQHQITTLYPQMRLMEMQENLFKSDLNGTDSKFNMILEVLDGRTNNAPLEIWEFYGCLINSLNPSGHSYEEDAEISKIDVSCTVDAVAVHRPARQIYGDREYDEHGAQDYYNDRDIFTYSSGVEPEQNTDMTLNTNMGWFEQVRGIV